MVSKGLNLLHKTEIITKKSSQRILLRPLKDLLYQTHSSCAELLNP